MKKFLITLFFIISLGLGALGWSYYNEISLSRVLFTENFPDNSDLSNNYFFAKSNRNLENLELKSSCDIKSNYIGAQDGINIFSFNLEDKDCKDFNVYLSENDKQIISTIKRVDIITKGDIIKFYSDFSDSDLDLQITSFQNKLDKLNSEKIPENKFLELILNQKKEKNKYYIELLNLIKQGRKEKYLIPTPGYSMPTQATRLPNAGRPYREAYTDSFHHGWDFYAPLRSGVVSLDDGVVIRVIKNYQFSDLEKINYSDNLSFDDRMINLDLLRGNQVWIKTLKGDVVLYSHLSVIYDDIEEGKFISKNYPVGKIGITGVPDADYQNYHVHVPIQVNPHNREKYGKYSYLDIMKWDWMFKGQTIKYVLEHQNEIFTK